MTRSSKGSLAICSMCLVTAMTAFVAAQNTQNSQRERPNAERQRNPQDSRVASARTPELRPLDPLAGSWRVTMELLDGNIDPVMPGGDVREQTDPRRNDRNSPSPSGSEHDRTAQRTMMGVATRYWTLNGSVLNEQVRFSSRPQIAPRTDERNPNPNEPGHEQFECLGLFTFDHDASRYNHVWADTKGDGLTLSFGEYDPGTRTLTFRAHASDESRNGQRRSPGTDRPGAGADDSRAGSGTAHDAESVVTLRIESNDRHTIQMRSPAGNGQTIQYKITYDRISDTGSDSQRQDSRSAPRERP